MDAIQFAIAISEVKRIYLEQWEMPKPGPLQERKILYG